jgi:hypothetical protein
MIWLVEIVFFFILWAIIGIVPAILIEAVCIFATLFYNHSKAQAAIGVALIQQQQAALAQQQSQSAHAALPPIQSLMPAPKAAPEKSAIEIEWERSRPLVSYDGIATGSTPEERVASVERFVEERGVKGVRFIETLEHEEGPHMVKWDFEDEYKDHNYYAINFRQMLATVDRIVYGDDDPERDPEDTFHIRQHEGKWQLRITNCCLDYSLAAIAKKGETDPERHDAEWVRFARETREKSRGLWFDAQFSEINPAILDTRYAKFLAGKKARANEAPSKAPTSP